VSELKPIGVNIFTIDSFLSSTDCSDFISQAEEFGFKPADVETGSSRTLMTNIRNNERVDYESTELAVKWWSYLSETEIPVIDGMRAVGISPRFRFYKYTPGQKFNMHKDGRQNVKGNTTLLTLLVYLNEGYQGGSTKFRQGEVDVEPAVGKALIFDHDLWHQGVEVQVGTKYVLRTDVIFE